MTTTTITAITTTTTTKQNNIKTIGCDLIVISLVSELKAELAYLNYERNFYEPDFGLGLAEEQHQGKAPERHST